MKDITIFENFINDEELEEARQFIGEQSLSLNNKYYGNPYYNRQWYFVNSDNAYKKILVNLTPKWKWLFSMESIIPSAENFILKIKNRINKCTNTNTNFELERVYLNRREYGQDGQIHLDDDRPNYYTLLIYIGDITPENYDNTGGYLELKTKEITRIEPFTKRAVLFKGYIPHQAYAPLVPGLTRISIALKFVDTSNELPFMVKYS